LVPVFEQNKNRKEFIHIIQLHDFFVCFCRSKLFKYGITLITYVPVTDSGSVSHS